MRNITTSTTAMITISSNTPLTVPPITATDDAGSLLLAKYIERICRIKYDNILKFLIICVCYK